MFQHFCCFLEVCSRLQNWILLLHLSPKLSVSWDVSVCRISLIKSSSGPVRHRLGLVVIFLIEATLAPLCSVFQESFVRAKNWVKELQRQASPNIVIALAGNKADLASKRALDFQVGPLTTLMTSFVLFRRYKHQWHSFQSF